MILEMLLAESLESIKKDFDYIDGGGNKQTNKGGLAPGEKIARENYNILLGVELLGEFNIRCKTLELQQIQDYSGVEGTLRMSKTAIGFSLQSIFQIFLVNLHQIEAPFHVQFVHRERYYFRDCSLNNCIWH